MACPPGGDFRDILRLSPELLICSAEFLRVYKLIGIWSALHKSASVSRLLTQPSDRGNKSNNWFFKEFHVPPHLAQCLLLFCSAK